MRTSRRILLVVLVLVASLLLSLGATAGAKGKPTQPAEYVYVTMGLLGDADGLATTCTGSDYLAYLDGDGAIQMQRAPMGWRYTASEGHGEWPILQIEAAIPWSRVYPLPVGLSGDSLTGCHGVYVANGSVPYTPLLMIDTDSCGKPISLAWHFDRYAEQEILRKGTVTRLFEGFDLISGDDFSCAGENPYSCSGTFTLQGFGGAGAVGDGESYFEFTIEFSSS